MPKYIESLLRKYIVEYVTCQMCRSPNTTLTRDPVSRLFFVHCQVSIHVWHGGTGIDRSIVAVCPITVTKM